MRRIVNPFIKGESLEYKCFGCSPYNKIGLHLEFYEDEDFIISEWYPHWQFEGYVNVLHGGIQTTLLDEIASWAVYVKCKTAGVTSSLSVRYRKPVFLSDGKITIKARLDSINRRIATIKAWIENSHGDVMAEADIAYYLFSEKEAAEKYNYPGYDEFFKEELIDQNNANQ